MLLISLIRQQLAGIISGAIVGGVVVLCLLTLVIAIIVIIALKRKKKSRSGVGSSCKSQDADGYEIPEEYISTANNEAYGRVRRL